MHPATTPRGAILQVLADPWNAVIRRWNWKAALLSSLFRSGVFFAANLPAGRRAAFAAMATELVYRGITSGFYAALTQAFCKIDPAWRAALTGFVLLPAFQHALELLVHYLRGTERLGVSILASVAFTGLSTIVNLMLMRNGVLVVGEGCQPLWRDLARLPLLLRAMFASLARALHRRAATEGAR